MRWKAPLTTTLHQKTFKKRKWDRGLHVGAEIIKILQTDIEQLSTCHSHRERVIYGCLEGPCLRQCWPGLAGVCLFTRRRTPATLYTDADRSDLQLMEEVLTPHRHGQQGAKGGWFGGCRWRMDGCNRLVNGWKGGRLGCNPPDINRVHLTIIVPFGRLGGCLWSTV